MSSIWCVAGMTWIIKYKNKNYCNDFRFIVCIYARHIVGFWVGFFFVNQASCLKQHILIVNIHTYSFFGNLTILFAWYIHSPTTMYNFFFLSFEIRIYVLGNGPSFLGFVENQKVHSLHAYEMVYCILLRKTVTEQCAHSESKITNNTANEWKRLKCLCFLSRPNY